jgi:maltose O-acetyltransferase
MESEKEKMMSGMLYSSNDPQLVEERLKAKKQLHFLNVTEYAVTDQAKAIINDLIPNAPDSLYIEPPFHCDYGYNIFCGENVYFNVNCVVLDVMKVTIGSNVFFGPGVHIYTATHPLDFKSRRSHEFGKTVIIGDDCWIGGGAMIMPGVTIGNRCVIGAGSVVTKDIPDDTIVAGNPARPIKKDK